MLAAVGWITTGLAVISFAVVVLTAAASEQPLGAAILISLLPTWSFVGAGITLIAIGHALLALRDIARNSFAK